MTCIPSSKLNIAGQKFVAKPTVDVGSLYMSELQQMWQKK